MEFLILIAVFVGYFLAIGRNVGLGAALHPVSLISSILGVMLIPLVPMIYCALFSLVLMAVLSKVRSTAVFYRMSSLFLFLFAALFVFSLRGIGEINMENYVESLGSGDNLFLRTLNIIFFPVPWLSEAISRGSILYLLLYLVGNVGLLAILFFLGKLLYQRGLYTAASLGSSKKADVKSKDIVIESPFMASVKKELRVILRTRAFSGNCAYINILWPVGAFLLFHFTRNKGGIASYISMFQEGNDRAEMILIIIMIAIAFIATALNSLAAAAFTREGQHLALIKFIPVPFRTQMYAKAFVCILFTYPALLATDIIVCIYMGASPVKCIAFALLMFLAHVISMILGMSLDSASPYVDWDDEYSALRGNLNTFFNMAVMMLIALVVGVIGVLLYEVLKLPILALYIILFLILGGATARLMVVGPARIVENMKKMS